ncbi:MAG: thiol reductant ABC exporter subunit CydC [Wenzhouxiangellaceae bacterium]|nr:thiol reductant ABC exporter subunit CydC [Wenzhouxiangellaceae bacterium]MBS3745539.1 thiol reductant ABC exporter subunit CydC [Wenzhouxiangellaceae bacterium]
MHALIRLLWPGRSTARWMLLAAIMALAAALLAVVLLAVSGWLITASALAGIGVIAALDIFAPGAIIRAAAVGRTVTRYLERLIGHEATFRQLTEIRIRAFRRLMAQSIARLEALGRGDTLSRLTRDVDVLDHVFPRLVLPSVGAFGAALLAIGYFLFQAPVAAAALAASLVGGGTLVLGAGTRLARGPGRALAEATPAMRSALAEWLHGVGELISVGRAEERAGRVMARVADQVQAQIAQRRIEAMMQTGIALFGYLAFWLVLLLVLGMYSAGSLAAPVAAGMALVGLALVDAWLPLAASWNFVETCRQAAIRVDSVGQEAGAHARAGDTARPSDFRLMAQQATFRYPGAIDPVIAGVDLELETAEHVLVQGASGAGKTTLGKLLAGILVPESGSVSLGGVDLSALDEPWLREHVGLLSQRSMLFQDTLAANLRLGAPAATDAELIRALHAVGLGDFVEQLTEGLDTWIGEHGRSVSGGEGRRLALARVLLADFRILVLDEPMAGVDSETAATVAERLVPWLEGRSVVVLSHDPKVLVRYDRRYRFTDGSLAAD